MSPSDAIMSSCKWSEIKEPKTHLPLIIKEKSVRGTISNEIKGAKADNLDAEVCKANLQTVDATSLPFSHDTLKLEFTLKFLGGITEPSACNNQDFLIALKSKVETYKKEYGFSELAKRYAINVANGRFLWNNRIGADSIIINVSTQGKDFTFDAHKHSLEVFESSDKDLLSFSKLVEKAFTQEEHLLIDVTAFVKLGKGQPVFPSQELLLDKDSSNNSKVLYEIDGQAAMHSQKIGNAIRSIDNWYEDGSAPIAVEVYGSVTNQGVANRNPKQKQDFYSLLTRWIVKGEEITENQKHYFVAMLIRGGVFGASK